MVNKDPALSSGWKDVWTQRFSWIDEENNDTAMNDMTTKHAEPRMYEFIVTWGEDGWNNGYHYADSKAQARQLALASSDADCEDFDLATARVYLIDRSDDEV